MNAIHPLRPSANLQAGICNLLYLLITADGKVSDKELEFTNKILDHEKITRQEFEARTVLLKQRSGEETLLEAVRLLEKLPIQQQIRCVAWLCIVANADSFMDSREWQLIYKVYAKHLKLATDSIMSEQKVLIKRIFSTTQSIGIKVNS